MDLYWLNTLLEPDGNFRDQRIKFTGSSAMQELIEHYGEEGAREWFISAIDGTGQRLPTLDYVSVYSLIPFWISVIRS